MKSDYGPIAVEQMSDADLRDNLVTADYRGREFKAHVLDELLKRATQPAVPNSDYATVLRVLDEYSRATLSPEEAGRGFGSWCSRRENHETGT